MTRKNTLAMLVGGTASNVGKSWMATAICRWLTRRGVRVAPFKAQNMSNNSYPCAVGGEIGRAQAAQAEACFLDPHPDMNPILLKPNSESGFQVVLNGRVSGTVTAANYTQQFPFLWEQVYGAYRRLAARFEYVVIEGAGSIAELNLKRTDLVNMGLATRLNVPVLLVADIEKGGVFASVAGTFSLLEPGEGALVRGFAINRFHGDRSLFAEGVKILEARTGRPCLGVFPYADGLVLDPEDSVSPGFGLDCQEALSDVAVIAFPHISNTSDFRLLRGARRVDRPVDACFTCVLLPGTKNTIGDLRWLRETGLADWILEQHRLGAIVIGVCGGYQMLGRSVADPSAVESSLGEIRGLGLLPVETVLATEKITRKVRAETPSGVRFEAYEIHMGLTRRPGKALPFAKLSDGTEDGLRTGNCIGTYLHGALEDAAVLSELLGRRVDPVPGRGPMYEALADWFESNVDEKRFVDLYL
jgi:adenosylcobyric acid synthase